MNDPLGDLLTRIRNAQQRRRPKVSSPASKLRVRVLDVLRDEGDAYARKLMQSGVSVTAVRYLGTIHGFVTLNRLVKTPAAKAAIQQIGKALRMA